jgi:hypothetical protein
MTVDTAAIRKQYVNFEDMQSPSVNLILTMCEEIDRLRKLKSASSEWSEIVIIPLGLLVLLFIAWKVRKLA